MFRRRGSFVKVFNRKSRLQQSPMRTATGRIELVDSDRKVVLGILIEAAVPLRSEDHEHALEL
jgi:hypothetical protein